MTIHRVWGLIVIARTPDIPSAVLRDESLRRERAAQVQRNSRNCGLVYDSGDSPERDEKLRGTVANLLWSLDYDVEAEVQSFLATAGT